MKIIIEITEKPLGRIEVKTWCSELATDKEVVVAKHAIEAVREAFNTGLPKNIRLEKETTNNRIIPLGKDENRES